MDGKKKVLLVDDDVDFVDMNRAVLEANGYEVIAAHDGEQCLAKVESDMPDLIVLDIMMATVSDGMFVAQQLKKDEATKAIPILCVTGVNQVPPFNIGPDQGWLPVDVFIEKPISPQLLLEQVSKALGGRSTRIEPGTP